MAGTIHPRLTPAEGRRFALTVGAAFLVLAALAWWRGHPALAAPLATLGGALGAAGLVVPGRLTGVHRGWMRLAHALSRVTTPIFLGVIYFGVLTPTGVIMRALGHRPLARTARDGSYFVTRPAGAARRGDLRRQF